MTRKEAVANLNMISVAFVEPVTKEQRKLIDDTFDMAIEALKFDIDQYCKEHFVVMVDEDVWEKAEKALEQEPCEDAISRQAVIELIGFYKNEMDCFSYSKLVEDVGLLLPFSQIQKEGDA